MEVLGKSMVAIGVVLVALGLVLWLLGRAGAAPLPGDIVVEKKNVTFYFPIVTCLAISAVLSLLFWLFRR